MYLFVISLIFGGIVFVTYVIWGEYHWRKLPDGRIYRINHTCLSSHIENQYIPQTSINPSNGQLTTNMVWQAVNVCDLEQSDTVWKNNK